MQLFNVPFHFMRLRSDPAMADVYDDVAKREMDELRVSSIFAQRRLSLDARKFALKTSLRGCQVLPGPRVGLSRASLFFTTRRG